MSRFALLLACIRSGQLTEAQIAAELRDPAFAAFWRQQTRLDNGSKSNMTEPLGG